MELIWIEYEEDWLRNMTFCKDCDHDRSPKIKHFGRSPNSFRTATLITIRIKTQILDILWILWSYAVLIKRIATMVRNPIKAQKHDIFVRTVIMIVVLINSVFCEDCNHDRSFRNRLAINLWGVSEIWLRLICEDCDHNHSPQKSIFMSTTIIFIVLYCDHFVKTAIWKYT